MRVETFTLIQQIIDSMDCSIAITSIDVNGAFVTLNTRNTKWISYNYVITINSVNYNVYSVTPNVSFTINTLDSINETSVLLNKPFFFHGTFSTQSAEMTMIDNENKFPFIYLNEPSNDVFYNSIEDARDRDSTCDLYFMTEANHPDWTNEQQHTFAITAMNNMFTAFIQPLPYLSFIGEFETFNAETHVKWGVITTQGHSVKIFNDDLSGKKLNITIPFLKTDCDSATPYVSPTYGDLDLIINFNGTEYYNESISEDTTINIVYT